MEQASTSFPFLARVPAAAASGIAATAALALAAALLPGRALAQPPWPSSAFVQGGHTIDDGTGSLTVGLGGELYRLNRYCDFQTTVELGYWFWRDGGETHSATRIGVHPALRLHTDGDWRWFVDAGIGVTATNRLYETRHKRFSTHFNFADHLGVGRRFGEQGRRELVLRVEHFSNAGIRRPNPGEDFWQLRYAWRWR